MPANHDRSRFINILSTISIMVALYSIVENYSTLSMQSNLEFQLVRQFMPSAFVSPVKVSIEIALNVAVIMASIGLYLRWNRGRVMYMIVVALITVWEIYSSISSFLALNRLLTGYDVGSSLSLIVVGASAGICINIFLIWKLSSADIRFEFGQSTKCAAESMHR